MPQRSVREQVVEAGLQQFHQHGFNGAGVKDITDAAAVPKGSFYNHFESKEALALEVLERYGQTLRMERLQDTSVPPLDRLREHFTFLREQITESGYTKGCLFGNFGAEMADHSTPIRAAVHTAFTSWGALLTACIEQGQADGSIRPGLNAADTALFVLNAWEGTAIAARADQSMAAFDAFFSLVFGTLLTAA